MLYITRWEWDIRTHRLAENSASVSDAAMLRKGIEILRLDYAILSRDDGKGYYLPETTDAGRADAKRWSKRQDRRVQAIRAAQAGALKFATGWKEPKGIYGQISMFRDGG